MAKSKSKNSTGKCAVIYARYSSDSQRDVSIEQQYAACEAYAARQGVTVIEHYADRAISGKTDNRPAFQRMMRDAQKGGFDYVIAWKSNRIGRNMLQAMMNEQKLAEMGVRCLYVEESFDDTAAGRFALRNMMNVNQFYIENMAEDVKRGMLDNASKCMVNNKPPLGYRKGQDGKFEIYEPEAEIVREIFSRILHGWTIIDIQTDLNRRGIKTSTGKEWKKQSFGHILGNDKYIGVYRFADVVIEDGVPAIIDKDTFDKVQRILQSKKKPRGKQRMNDEYLLTGKVFCGKCGSPMTAQTGTGRSGKKFNYYSCNRKRYDHACNKKNEPQAPLESFVIEAVRAELTDDKIIENIVDGYRKAIAMVRNDSKKDTLQDELSAVNKEIENFLKAIGAGVFNEFTQQRMEELRDTRKELEEAIRLEDAATRLPPPKKVGGWLCSIRDGDWTDRKFVKELIRIFVRAVYVFDDKITIHYNYGTEEDLEYTGLAEETDDGNPEAEVFSKSPDRCTKSKRPAERLAFYFWLKVGEECACPKGSAATETRSVSQSLQGVQVPP